MHKIVGIQFRDHGKVYDFDSGHFVLNEGDKVIVITKKGPAIGCVYSEPHQILPDVHKRQLKKVFRLATEEEIRKYEQNHNLELTVFNYCNKKLKEKSMLMCLVSVEKRFESNKIVVYFTADGRVDFRELVKDLVKKFRTRIEMRQIGIRHQAKMVGGLGPCGRVLCCTTFLNNFAPVTIKMAKEQNVSLNPSKISGLCGRLMCCLAFEHEYYEKIKKTLPRIGKKVQTARGRGQIIRQNLLKQTLTVNLNSGGEIEVHSGDLIRGPKPKKKQKRSNH